MAQQIPALPPAARNRPVLAEAVTRELVRDVVTGRYAAGTALPSTVALCEMFAVSRTVVREAITALTEKGLVAARQGWGTVVLGRDSWRLLDPIVLEAIFQRDDGLLFMDQLIEIRTALESLMAASAAREIADHDREDLATRFETLEVALADREGYDEADIAFHAAIHRLSGNEFAREIIATIQGKARLVAEYTGAPPHGHTALTHEEHRHIHEAVVSGDAEASADLMRAHIARSWSRRRPHS